MDIRDRLARDAANQLENTELKIADLGPQFTAVQDDDIFLRTLNSIVVSCYFCGSWNPPDEMNHLSFDRFCCDPCYSEHFCSGDDE